jgi:hypothetical protein
MCLLHRVRPASRVRGVCRDLATARLWRGLETTDKSICTVSARTARLRNICGGWVVVCGCGVWRERSCGARGPALVGFRSICVCVT